MIQYLAHSRSQLMVAILFYYYIKQISNDLRKNNQSPWQKSKDSSLKRKTK